MKTFRTRGKRSRLIISDTRLSHRWAWRLLFSAFKSFMAIFYVPGTTLQARLKHGDRLFMHNSSALFQAVAPAEEAPTIVIEEPLDLALAKLSGQVARARDAVNCQHQVPPTPPHHHPHHHTAEVNKPCYLLLAKLLVEELSTSAK